MRCCIFGATNWRETDDFLPLQKHIALNILPLLSYTYTYGSQTLAKHCVISKLHCFVLLKLFKIYAQKCWHHLRNFLARTNFTNLQFTNTIYNLQITNNLQHYQLADADNLQYTVLYTSITFGLYELQSSSHTLQTTVTGGAIFQG